MRSFFVTAFLPVVLLSGLMSKEQTHPIDYVNPLIGTAPMTDKQYLGNNPAPGEELYYGCVNPGAMVPYGTGHLCTGPVSGYDGERYHVRGSGYRYTDKTLMGFTILNGEYHDDNKLLLMPTVGEIRTIPGTRANPFEGYRSAKDTSREHASPDISVFLTTYGIKVELTATKNCGFQRYTFPASRQANILIDLSNSQPFATHAAVHIVDGHTIAGYQDFGKDTVYHLVGSSRIYFYAMFSKSFSTSGTWKNTDVSPGLASAEGMPLGAFASFSTTAGEMILVKVGTSTVSEQAAKQNLASEIPGMDFKTIRQQAETQWSAILNRVVVEGGSKADRINFYTAVYRKNGYSWNGNSRLEEKKTGSRPAAFLELGGGYWGTGSTGGLVGAYKSGNSSVDIRQAYAVLKEEALHGGGAAGAAYRQYGYIPPGVGVDDYINRSLGLAYEDYALSELATLVGQRDDHDIFLARSKNYKKLFNSTTEFFTPRRADGSWILPLNPYDFHAEDIYREGNAWNYLWFNIGDVDGLIRLLGGTTAFIAKLDTFFTKQFPADATPLRDCTGLLGLYCHGNEQYRNIPYLYNYAGQPWKTQAVVRRIQRELYRSVPGGFAEWMTMEASRFGMPDNALGFYQADAASGYYQIGTPLFPKVKIAVGGAHPGMFTMEAHNVSDVNRYVQSATLNGHRLEACRFLLKDVVAGGRLVFEMGPIPELSVGESKINGGMSL